MAPGVQEGVKVWVGGSKGKNAFYPETVCKFPSNLVGLTPREFEPEVVDMGHVAPEGPRGGAPGGKLK